jgi:hypothetical protein
MYFALGPDAKERAGAYMRNYYGTGPMVDSMINALPTTLDVIKGSIQAYAAIGADEFILWPCVPDLEIIDQLARLIT